MKWCEDKRSVYEVIKDMLEVKKMSYGEIVEMMRYVTITVLNEIQEEKKK